MLGPGMARSAETTRRALFRNTRCDSGLKATKTNLLPLCTWPSAAAGQDQVLVARVQKIRANENLVIGCCTGQVLLVSSDWFEPRHCQHSVGTTHVATARAAILSSYDLGKDVYHSYALAEERTPYARSSSGCWAPSCSGGASQTAHSSSSLNVTPLLPRGGGGPAC